MFEKLKEKIINNKLKFCVSLLAFAIIISGIAVTINNTGNTYADSIDDYTCDSADYYVLQYNDSYYCCPNGYDFLDDRCAKPLNTYAEAVGQCSTYTQINGKFYCNGTIDGLYIVSPEAAVKKKVCNQCNSNSNILEWGSTTNSNCGGGWHVYNATEDSCKSYTISYDLKGGTGSISYQYKAHGVDTKITSVIPTKSGYDFKGWCVHTGANTVDFVSGATYNSNANITLYAVYETSSNSGNTTTVTPDISTKSLRYIKDSGYASCYESASTSSAAKKTFDKCTSIYIADTNSNNWKYSTSYECYIPSSYITSTKPSSCSSNSGGSDTTTEKYTIIYDLNGAAGEAPATQTKTKGTDLTLSDAKPTWSGYTFLGWNTDKNATVASYNVGSVYSVDANATLYAIWKQDDSTVNTYTITYDANGGIGAPASQSKTHGVNVTLSTQIPTRDGYTFLGWNTDKNATVSSYKVGAEYSVDANATLYAVWEENPKEDEDIEDNIQTGGVMIALVWLIGLGTLGYSIYYFRTRKMDI